MASALWLYLISYAVFSLPSLAQGQPPQYCSAPTTPTNICLAQQKKIELHKIKRMLTQQDTAMQPAVVNKVLHSLSCAKKNNTEHNNILTVIDFSLPSSEKRLWVFDLSKNHLLFHTYVSHGIRSGKLNSDYFSNVNNSKASSIGVFKTAQSYYGRYGLALKLEGLEKGINDQAFRRAIVMHGGWYVDEAFIKKYGRAGRSWGCPALPPKLYKSIINTIKDGALVVAYYPSEKWYVQSKYLNCKQYSAIPLEGTVLAPLREPNENRDPILFVEKNGNNHREENEPIVAMSADDYQQLFQHPVPLTRMLRRSINNTQYIALNAKEFETAINDSRQGDASGAISYKDKVRFIIPVVKRVRGYYATEMRMLKIGAIERLRNNDPSKQENFDFTLHLKDKPALQIKSSEQFIRWLGL